MSFVSFKPKHMAEQHISVSDVFAFEVEPNSFIIIKYKDGRSISIGTNPRIFSNGLNYEVSPQELRNIADQIQSLN